MERSISLAFSIFTAIKLFFWIFSSITESQNFEQSMSTIESMGKQVLDCGKAEFWCYDGAENKYFTNDENRAISHIMRHISFSALTLCAIVFAAYSFAPCLFLSRVSSSVIRPWCSNSFFSDKSIVLAIWPLGANFQVKPDKEITQENAFSFFEKQLKFADELAYAAKETGRNKVFVKTDCRKFFIVPNS